MGADTLGFTGTNIEPQVVVDARIGEGGFSVVYRGRHLGLGEQVAVKCLKLPGGLTPPVLEHLTDRFRAESRISYRLSQGNLDIVRSISSGTATSPTTGAVVPYIVLEWLEGLSLAQDFKKRRAAGAPGRPLDEVTAMFEPAALALAYAHKQGVVHRDVKPGNLFLAESRNGTRLKVLDFGMAKVVDQEGLGMSPTATVSRTALCSPSYGAPEHFDPRFGPIGPWTDVYALVLVMLEALAGKKARPADSMVDAARIALDPAKIVTAHSLGVKVPAKVEVLFARAVAVEKTQRPKDAGEFWEELKSLLARGDRTSRAPDAVTVGVAQALTVPLENRAGGATLVLPTPVPAPPPALGFGGTLIMGKVEVPPDAPSEPPVTRPMPLADPAFAKPSSAVDLDPTRIGAPLPAPAREVPPPPVARRSAQASLSSVRRGSVSPRTRRRAVFVAACTFVGTLLVLVAALLGYRYWRDSRLPAAPASTEP